MDGRESIYGLGKTEVVDLCRGLGQPDFRGKQVWQWLYQRVAADWDQMKNLPADLRGALARQFSLQFAKAAETRGRPGATQKILVEFPDGERVETVAIPAPGRLTVCVSSQVGCRFACAFCASGQAGFVRNLTTAEIVAQLLLAAEATGRKPSHVVFMGVGEPFDNYDAVLKAVRIINDADGLAIGARRITISTCGVIPGIERLAGEKLQVELSVSLHAADPALRTRWMPVTRKYALAALVEACRRYVDVTGRIITFEYTLVCGVNDGVVDARKLVQLLSGLKCRINLIPLSPVAEFAGRASEVEVVETFRQALERAHINVTVRMSKGSDLDAACGQLRIRNRRKAGSRERSDRA